MTHGILNVTDLHFRFTGQSADLFRIASLSLAQGQTLGIRGASGAGKTTLLHCLAGIEPARGKLCWGDHNLCAMPAAALACWRQQHLGLVFQDFHLVEGLSALDNVLLPASFTNWRAPAAQRSRAHELLERVGIATPRRHAELLSRGERQRVAVARALLFAPEILLADEPTASLDPDNREQVGSLILELAREQSATLVVVSHEESLLARLDVCHTLGAGTLAPQETANV